MSSISVPLRFETVLLYYCWLVAAGGRCGHGGAEATRGVWLELRRRDTSAIASLPPHMYHGLYLSTQKLWNFGRGWTLFSSASCNIGHEARVILIWPEHERSSDSHLPTLNATARVCVECSTTSSSNHGVGPAFGQRLLRPSYVLWLSVATVDFGTSLCTCLLSLACCSLFGFTTLDARRG